MQRCARTTARATRRAQFGITLDCTEALVEEDSPVVKAALRLRQQEPELSALEILDRAIEAHDGRSLDYEFGDELEPPHRFSELIRRAFAPHLDPIELLIGLTEVEPNDLIRTEWQRALIRFAKRYKIWEPQK